MDGFSWNVQHANVGASVEYGFQMPLPLQELGQYRGQQYQLPRNLIVGINAATLRAAANTNHLPACLNTFLRQ